MEMTVLVERLADDKYRASTECPVAMESEGSSPNEAVEKLREQAVQRFTGSELVHVSLPGVNDSSPWLKYAGIWRDHPHFDRFLDDIAEYLRTVDEANSTQ